MKHAARATGLAVLVLLAILVCLCVMPVPTGQSATLPGVPLVAGNNEFAFDLYQKIRGTRENDNVCFSPFSISAALGMTYAGARGDTEKQMAGVMHFGLAQGNLVAAFSKLSQQLQGSESKSYQLKMANALWGQKEYPFRSEFLELIRKDYENGFHTADFADDSENSRQIINDWIKQQTAGKIENLLHPGDILKETRLVLTNAIYFKGDWDKKFKKAATESDPFYVRPDAPVSVPMMHQTSSFGYTSSDGVQVLEMTYVGGDLSMIVLLPQEGLRALDLQFTNEKLNQWLVGLKDREVKVSLPTFKFEARYGLQELLPDMGMPNAFDKDRADFSGMTDKKDNKDNKDLYIGKVIHQAAIDVNEEGTEATAATAVAMLWMGSAMPQTPVEFTANRPFVFLIRHKTTGSILFMGRIANPAAPMFSPN